MTVRISCSCGTCRTNAAKVGATFPLSAIVPAKLATAVGSDTHALVYDAHNPSALGAAVRRATGITPA